MPKNNSSLRGAIVGALSDGVPTKEAASLLGVSASTVQRSRIANSSALQAAVKGYSVESRRFCKELGFIMFIEIACPVLSGRQYRSLGQAKVDLFDDYNRWLEQKGYEVYKKSAFYNRLLLERLHKTMKGVPCPTCETLRELREKDPAELPASDHKKLAKCERHEIAVQAQRAQYRADRQQLKQGQLLVVQDFTKHDNDIHAPTQQDHIVVMYWMENDKEQYIMEHFIAPEGVKNDVRFSMHVWYELQLHQQVVAAEEIIVWSDNGPKHFKLTAFLHYMSCWANTSSKKVSLRFNAPYHGACVADSAAAHLKRRTARHIARTGDNMKDPQTLVTLANALKSHAATLVSLPPDSEKPQAKTWNGLTQYYHWEPVPGRGMKAWHCTKDFLSGGEGTLYEPDPTTYVPYQFDPETSFIHKAPVLRLAPYCSVNW